MAAVTNKSSVEATRIIEQVLLDCIRRYATDDARMFPVFDRDRGHFLIVEEGWNGAKRLYNPFVHVEWRGDQVWVQQDFTNHGIANELVAAGIAKDQIILAYKAPTLRSDTEFAIV